MTTPAAHNGCHNRPEYKTRVVVQDGWFMDGVTRVPKMISLPFRNSAQCNYTHTSLCQADERCKGCKHRALPKGS